MAIVNLGQMDAGIGSQVVGRLASADLAGTQATAQRIKNRASRVEVDEFIAGAKDRKKKAGLESKRIDADLDLLGFETKAKKTKFQEEISESVMNTGEAEIDNFVNLAGPLMEAEAGSEAETQALAALAMGLPEDQRYQVMGDGGKVDAARARLMAQAGIKSKKFRQAQTLQTQAEGATTGDIGVRGEEQRETQEAGGEIATEAAEVAQENKLLNMEAQFDYDMRLQESKNEAAYRKALVSGDKAKMPKLKDMINGTVADFTKAINGVVAGMVGDDIGGHDDMDDEGRQGMSRDIALRSQAQWQEQMNIMFAAGKGYMVPSPISIARNMVHDAFTDGNTVVGGVYRSPEIQSISASRSAAVAQKAADDKAADLATRTDKVKGPSPQGLSVVGIVGDTINIPGLGKQHSKSMNKHSRDTSNTLMASMSSEIAAIPRGDKTGQYTATVHKYEEYNNIATEKGFRSAIKNLKTPAEVMQTIEGIYKSRL